MAQKKHIKIALKIENDYSVTLGDYLSKLYVYLARLW